MTTQSPTDPRNQGREAEFLERQVCFGRLPSARRTGAVIWHDDAEYELRRFLDRDDDSCIVVTVANCRFHDQHLAPPGPRPARYVKLKTSAWSRFLRLGKTFV